MLQQLYYTITNKTTPYFIPYFQQKKRALALFIYTLSRAI